MWIPSCSGWRRTVRGSPRRTHIPPHHCIFHALHTTTPCPSHCACLRSQWRSQCTLSHTLCRTDARRTVRTALPQTGASTRTPRCRRTPHALSTSSLRRTVRRMHRRTTQLSRACSHRLGSAPHRRTAPHCRSCRALRSSVCRCSTSYSARHKSPARSRTARSVSCTVRAHYRYCPLCSAPHSPGRNAPLYSCHSQGR